mgnify:CR=1 FL=1
MAVKLLPVLAVLGMLHAAYPAYADPFEDASEAFDNLGDLVESLDKVGNSLGRVVQPRQYRSSWYRQDWDRDDDWSDDRSYDRRSSRQHRDGHDDDDD